MGKLFNKMVDDYREKSKNFWSDILEGAPALSKEEANAMINASKRIRREYGFRN